MTNVANFPLLSLILFLPLVGRGDSAVHAEAERQCHPLDREPLRRSRDSWCRVPLWFWYNPQDPSFQFVERHPWIPSIGAQYFLGVDGFSALLVLLATLFGSIAILSSWTRSPSG